MIEPVDSLTAIGGKGFSRDYSFGKRRRQASMISTFDLDSHGYAPGMLRENVTLDVPGLQALPVGTRFMVGEVEFEIEQDCAPCGGMARRLGEEPKAFMEKTRFRRGMLCRVVSSGTLRVGDRVQVRGG